MCNRKVYQAFYVSSFFLQARVKQVCCISCPILVTKYISRVVAESTPAANDFPLRTQAANRSRISGENFVT